MNIFIMISKTFVINDNYYLIASLNDVVYYNKINVDIDDTFNNKYFHEIHDNTYFIKNIQTNEIVFSTMMNNNFEYRYILFLSFLIVMSRLHIVVTVISIIMMVFHGLVIIDNLKIINELHYEFGKYVNGKKVKNMENKNKKLIEQNNNLKNNHLKNKVLEIETLTKQNNYLKNRMLEVDILMKENDRLTIVNDELTNDVYEKNNLIIDMRDEINKLNSSVDFEHIKYVSEICKLQYIIHDLYNKAIYNIGKVYKSTIINVDNCYLFVGYGNEIYDSKIILKDNKKYYETITTKFYKNVWFHEIINSGENKLKIIAFEDTRKIMSVDLFCVGLSLTLSNYNYDDLFDNHEYCCI